MPDVISAATVVAPFRRKSEARAAMKGKLFSINDIWTFQFG
jgi:hypothetical protein